MRPPCPGVLVLGAPPARKAEEFAQVYRNPTNPVNLSGKSGQDNGFPRPEGLGATYPAASRCRSLYRWIFPVAVLGSSGTNSTQRGYLYGASRSLTCCLRASASAGVPWTPGFVTPKALGLISCASSGMPTTAASSTSA